MTTVLEALHMGLDHHMAGRLNEAKEVYERILDADPQQPSAHHLLGLIAAQAGDVEHGITLIQKAIQLDASNSDFHANLRYSVANTPTADWRFCIPECADFARERYVHT
ncbi:MAG TPA: tetratricopeptide repeat protein [Azospirillum sp.]